VKILLCSEFFYPSVGGAQEVVKQLAVRLVQRGHQVTVATSKLKNREFDHHLGIEIKSFPISGNLVNGLAGDINSYRQFVEADEFDLIFIYAAQQWTFDAIWDLLPNLKMRKVFVPCGYSGLSDSAYRKYFLQLPSILKYFDAIVYHAYEYRDYRFACKHQLQNSIFIANGADEQEFSNVPAKTFRHSHGIAKTDLVFLTVGSLNGAKGHLEVTRAFTKANFSRPAILVLNGNTMPSSDIGEMQSKLGKFIQHLQKRGAIRTLRFVLAAAVRHFGFRLDHFSILKNLVQAINNGNYGPNKKALIVNLPRAELITAFFESDLFVFASLIEYSPLVLYESCAAGLPFLSVPVGNAEEIAHWTGGGEICAASTDAKGFTRVDPLILASDMERLAADQLLLKKLGDSGRAAWEQRFNWNALTTEYENLFLKLSAETEVFGNNNL
jgi:glycosyltransferase involved in cell wall biosynthesis